MTTIRVLVTSKSHPHHGESGTLTGKVVHPDHVDKRMFEVKLDDCRHGVEACYAHARQLTKERRAARA